MDQSEFQRILRELHATATLSDPTAAKLAKLVSDREIATGTVLFEEGDINPWLYLIIEGQIGLEMCVPARGCARILTLGPGDLLAWSSLLGEGRMTAAAQALSKARVLVARAQDIDTLCAADPEFGFEFYRGVATALSKRLTATRLQLLDLFGDAPSTGGTAQS